MSRHVTLNGVQYRLAEDAEGQHYVHNLEPLRVPNAQIVQGDSEDFQLRPDVMLWRLTDWSGGEGQLKFDSKEPGRHYVLQGVDPFSRPGSLLQGYNEFTVQASGGGDLSITDAYLGTARGKVYAIPRASNAVYEITGGSAAAALTPSPAANGVLFDTVGGDENYLFFCDAAGQLIRYDGSTWLVLNNKFDVTSSGVGLVMGPYYYFLNSSAGKLFELSKTTVNTSTTEAPLFEFTPGQDRLQNKALVAGDNRVYFARDESGVAVIYEVVPSSAAGAGYGREIARIEGFIIESLWFQGGTLYFTGVDTQLISASPTGPQRFIFYLSPSGGTYGTLGAVRSYVTSPTDHGIPPTDPSQPYINLPATASRLARSAFALPPTYEEQDADDVAMGLFETDSVTGGFAAVGRFDPAITAHASIQGLTFTDGYYLVASHTDDKIYGWNIRYRTLQPGLAVSPYHDFGVASEKILESIEVTCDPLPAGCSIKIGYSLDGGTWVDTTIANTTGAKTGRLDISTDSSTKTFNNLQIRAELISNTISDTLALTSIDVYARVNRHINTWELLLDCSDDAAPLGYSGAQIIDNVLAVPDNTVVDFNDAYDSHVPGEGTEYDVLIDAASVVLSQQGEGIVATKLIEVI